MKLTVKDVRQRILYIEATGEIGGSGVSLLTLINKLDRYEPYVVVPTEGPLVKKLREIEIPVYVLPLFSGNRKNPALLIYIIFKLSMLIRKLKINLVHANHEFVNSRAYFAARFAMVPYICHIRNIQHLDFFKQYWLGLPQVLIANSKITEQSFINKLRKNQRSFVIYNGVDLNYFDGRRITKEKLGFTSGDFVVAQLSRFVSDKGIHIFIQAIAILVERYPFIRAVIAGDTSVDGNVAYVSMIKKMVEDLSLRRNIVFVGFIDEVRNLYGAVDLVVQPSLYESFGRVLIEAMAMKVPVIASKIGGHIEIIKHGESGLLVPPSDPAALAQAIEQVITDKSLKGKLVENGRRVVEQRFSQETHVEKIQTFYDQILKEEKYDRR